MKNYLNAQETLETINGTLCEFIRKIRNDDLDDQINRELCQAHDHIINALDWVNSYIDDSQGDL